MTFETEFKLLLVWAVVGMVGAVALTMLIIVRKAPPLTTQVDHKTGIKHHGVMLWFGFFSLFTVGPPVIILTLRSAAVFSGWLLASMEWWWVVVAAAVLGLGLFGWKVVRSMLAHGHTEGGELPTFLPEQAQVAAADEQDGRITVQQQYLHPGAIEYVNFAKTPPDTYWAQGSGFGGQR